MSKRKRLKKLLVAAGVMGCMVVTAYAADNLLEINETSTSQSGNVSITATTKMPVEPTYTITIDDTINVGDLTKTATSSIKSTSFEVAAGAVENLEAKKINVTVSTESGNFALLDTKGNSLPYKVFNTASEGKALNNGDAFATFSQASSRKGRIEIDQKDIPETGSYKGVLVFTISVDNAGFTGEDGNIVIW